jgi:uncharacterized protein
VSAYLDASVLVALFTDDALTPRATKLMGTALAPYLVSDFAALEFASAISRIVRMKALPRNAAQQALADLDAWVSRSALRVGISADDIGVASGFIRRLDLNLRGPDAMHIALAQRLGATLYTLDAKLKTCAKELGLPVG